MEDQRDLDADQAAPGRAGLMTVPPFFDRIVPERACTRAIDNEGTPCGRSPVLHVAWADTLEGIEAGWVCDDHVGVLAVWKPLQAHTPGVDCGMPGARWFLEVNVCRCEDELSRDVPADEESRPLGDAVSVT